MVRGHMCLRMMSRSLAFRRKKAWAFFLLPALTLFVYLPPVFKQLTHNRLELQKFLVQASLAWIWV